MASNIRTVLILIGVTLLAPVIAFAQADRFQALANSPQFENRPTVEAAAALMDELLFQRASQTYLWAMPLINTLGMKTGSEKTFGAGYHVLPIWKKRLSAKTLVTTPNSDVIYAMSYVDLSGGPLVFEAPPKLQGILLDFWQRPIQGPIIRGQNYMVANFDSKGVFLSGSKNYKVTLPANIPAANFWSITLYDAANSSGLDNGQPFPSLGSRDKPAVNADGSVDLYFGAKTPAGKKKNWLATVPGRGFFAIIRLYSPTEGSFDGSWKPSDFMEID